MDFLCHILYDFFEIYDMSIHIKNLSLSSISVKHRDDANISIDFFGSKKFEEDPYHLEILLYVALVFTQ